MRAVLIGAGAAIGIGVVVAILLSQQSQVPSILPPASNSSNQSTVTAVDLDLPPSMGSTVVIRASFTISAYQPGGHFYDYYCTQKRASIDNSENGFCSHLFNK